MVLWCTVAPPLSMSVLELTILPGLPGGAGAPLKPISPFGMSSRGTEFSNKKLNDGLNCITLNFILPDLLHYPQPQVTHPNRSGPDNKITRQENNCQHVHQFNFFCVLNTTRLHNTIQLHTTERKPFGLHALF